MDQIAGEAGLGVATLYRHFGDRRSLIDAFLEVHTPQHAFQEVARRSSGDLRVDLTALVAKLLVFLHENRDVIWLGLVEGEETVRLLEGLRGGPEGTRAALRRMLERAVEAGQLAGNAEKMTTALAGMLMAFGLEVPVFGGGRLEDIEGTAEFVVRVFWDGVSKATEVPDCDPSQVVQGRKG